MLITTGLPQLGPLALCILNAQEVSTKGMYRLPLARVRLYVSYVLVWRPRINGY